MEQINIIELGLHSVNAKIPFSHFKEVRLRFTTSTINQWQRVLLICTGGWGHANAIKSNQDDGGLLTGPYYTHTKRL